MRLKANNINLTENQIDTALTAAATAADVTITVIDSSGFADNDYILVGKMGENKTEIMQVNGTPTQTVITVDRSGAAGGLRNNHDIDIPITKIDYNQVRFYRGTTTVAADSTALAAAQNIDPTEIYSYYEDTNTTGYGFIRFYNSTSENYSVYSDAVSYANKTGYTDRMLRSIRNQIRRKIKQTDETNSDYTNDEINEEINIAQKTIAHDRMWSFYEKTKSFSSVANQYEYDLGSDVFTLFDAMYDTQPLAVTDRHRMNMLRWDTDVTGDPTHIIMWNRKAVIYPYPSDSADTTTLDGAISSATATTITVASTSSFQTQGRFIVDSEVISYTGKTSTTFTGCTRGDEDTTAATHLTGATVTERDFLYHFQEEPDDLEDETDETAIPDPKVIVFMAGAELSESALHDRLLVKSNNALAQLRKVDEPKIKRAFGQVRDISEVVSDLGRFGDQNQYPQNLTGA